MFVDIIGEYIRTPKYTSVAWSGFTNSSYTVQLKDDSKCLKPNNIKIREQFKYLLDNIGDTPCNICGNNYTNLDIAATRNMLPGIVSNTFFNFSNNLQATNICPVCLFFSLISILNMRKCRNTILYNSDSNIFMKEYTSMLQDENIKYIAIHAEADKDKPSNYKNLEFTLKWYVDHIINNGYVIQVAFDNLGQQEEYRDTYISSKNIEFLQTLKEHDILDEFFESGLIPILFKNNLNNEYLDKLITNENILRCSEELFKAIDKGMNTLDADTTELIVNICHKLIEINQKNEIDALKEIHLYSQYEDLILKWQENYKKETGENLLNNIEDFERLTNKKSWISTRRRLISQFIILYA